MPDNIIAELKNVSLIYHEPQRETKAVEGLDLVVKKGEFLAIVGPSGCGKTSVLGLLTGQMEPSKGSVTVLGGPPGESLGRIGYMLQRDELLDWRTIERNVLLGLEVKGELNERTRKKTLEMLDKYGLSEFRGHYPSALSGGMRQKAALIRTLAFSPELLLLDEPFSALDYQTRLTLEDEVRLIIKQGGYTAVLVTHDISEAISMCDRAAVFSSRPARVKKLFDIELTGSAFERRRDPRFAPLFDSIWKELKNDER